MKKAIVLTLLLILGGWYWFHPIQEPKHCALCADLPRHALCIVNLSTGEKRELDIYEPHPSIVGEIAEEQPGGYFCFIRGDGISGYKIAAECIEITISKKIRRIDPHYFCISCRDQLDPYAEDGFVLVDLINPDNPVVYPVRASVSGSVRCYIFSVAENSNDQEYIITIVGRYSQ